MEYTELIHEFTDGTLDSLREPELFNVLATNEELRTEFKQQLAMKSAIRTDAKAYTPTAQSTLQIFQTLGFVPPAPVASGSAGTAGGTVAKSAGFFSKFGTALITAAVAVVTTGIIAYWLFNSELDGLKSENKNLTVALQKAELKNKIPVVKNFAVDESENKSAGHENVKIKYVYIQESEDKSKKSDDVLRPAQDDSEQLPITNYGLRNEDEVIGNAHLAIGNSQLFERASFGESEYTLNLFNDWQAVKVINNGYLSDEMFFENPTEDLGISLEFMNMENWFDVAPTISPKEYNKFNNTSLSVFYSLFNNFHLGAEYRRETFFQRFEGLDENAKLNRYEQQPNFESIGLVLRYADKDFNLWGIYPYFQIYGGGTNVGYIFRTGVGLKYSLFNNLSFVLGAGSSSLSFKHNGTSWQSNRYDLNYGISFEF